MKLVNTGTLYAAELSVSLSELGRRLGVPPEEVKNGGPYSEILTKCKAALFDEVNIRYAFCRTEAEITEGKCCFGSFVVESRHLSRNLRGCREVFMMGVTLGPGADRLLKRLSLTSGAEHFVTDALASALVEAAADRMEELARESAAGNESCSFRPRYSPGYGDCSLETQRFLLGLLEGEKNLGISLNESCFMRPSKSITAIMGVCPKE